MKKLELVIVWRCIINLKSNKKLIIVLIISIVVFLILWVGYTLYQISYYLKEYGYGMNELPKTVAVYFHLSKGFTVEEVEETGASIFIGRHNYIYDDVLKKKGYEQIDRNGTLIIYKNKDGSIIKIGEQSEWCHWFRVYVITDRIENFV